MTRDYASELERIRDRIRESDDLHDDDRENRLAFSRQSTFSRRSTAISGTSSCCGAVR